MIQGLTLKIPAPLFIYFIRIPPLRLGTTYENQSNKAYMIHKSE